MNKLELRKKLVSDKYKLEDYEKTENILRGIYKDQIAEQLVDYLIKNNKNLNSLNAEEKKKIISELIKKNGVNDLEISEDASSVYFSFSSNPKELGLQDPVKITVVLKNEEENPNAANGQG